MGISSVNFAKKEILKPEKKKKEIFNPLFFFIWRKPLWRYQIFKKNNLSIVLSVMTKRTEPLVYNQFFMGRDN